MKILFIGSRLFDDVYFYLKETNIYGILTESNKDALNLDLADEYHIVSRGMDEPIKIAIENEVDAVVPLIGIDTPLLDVAIMKEKLEKEHNIPVIASNSDVIKITSDKIKTKEFFKDNSILTPSFKVITKNDLNDSSFNFPLVLKQSEGQGGKDIEVSKNLESLSEYLNKFEIGLSEEFIEGSEISVEVLGYKGDYVPLTPIYKGETSLEGVHPLNKIKYGPFTSEHIKNNEIQEIALKIAKLLGADGISEIDFIFSSKNLKLYAIEVNNRPNGTRYLTSATCGINTLLKLIDMARGEFSSENIKKELKEFSACEIPIGTFNGEKPNEPLKSFKNNDYIVHGPEEYERITLRSDNLENLKFLIKKLKLEK